MMLGGSEWLWEALGSLDNTASEGQFFRIFFGGDEVDVYAHSVVTIAT